MDGVHQATELEDLVNFGMGDCNLMQDLLSGKGRWMMERLWHLNMRAGNV